MEIRKPKSHNPFVHDNTDEHIIMVPPSVLENKLTPFEDYIKIRGSIGSNVGLALMLFVTIITADFQDFAGISGASIRGAFVTGFIAMVVVVIYDFLRLNKITKRSRKDIVADLLLENSEKVYQSGDKKLKKQNAN